MRSMTSAMRIILLGIFLTITLSCQQAEKVDQKYFANIRTEFNGQNAYEIVDYMEDYWRIAGNEGFNKSIQRVVESLEAAGYVLEAKATDNDVLTYRVESRPMKRLTWEPKKGVLALNGKDNILLSYPENFSMLTINSWSTPETGVTAEVIKISNPEDYQKVDVKGKIVFVEGSPSRNYKSAILEEGAIGILSYNMPSYLQPEKHVTSIQFRSIPQDTVTRAWAIALSYEAKTKLEEELAAGPVEAYVEIDTELYPSEELTIVAQARGQVNTDEELVFSAHVQEPGANDNASGVGAQTEMARVTAKLIQDGVLTLDRTITFLFGDEIISTRRYVEADSLHKIKWGISLDMVGEDTDVTGGSFLVERMPDPGAVWLRGNDKHTEWGGRPLALEDVKPHYLNDVIIDAFEEQGAFANWTVNSNPFEGGSDHVPFLRGDIPGVLLWHFTDQFYHTSNDRIDKVSSTTMQNVGTGALAVAYQLANLNGSNANQLLSMLESRGLARLNAEFELSKAELKASDDFARQEEIMDSWREYYLGAGSALINDVSNPTNELLQAFDAYEQAIDSKVDIYLQELEDNK